MGLDAPEPPNALRRWSTTARSIWRIAQYLVNRAAHLQ